jgi:hypothetical protein
MRRRDNCCAGESPRGALHRADQSLSNFLRELQKTTGAFSNSEKDARAPPRRESLGRSMSAWHEVCYLFLRPPLNGEEDATAMNINYDLEFDLDGFLSDLEKRQSNQKRSRLEERKKESRRIRHEIERHGEKARH